MAQTDSFRRFVLYTLSMCLTFIIFSIGLNVLADPWSVFETPRLSGFNSIKVGLDGQSCLYKACQIRRQKPSALLLGSSRVMAGFNPDYLEKLTGEKAYNAGFAGATFDEIFHYFQYALHMQPELKVVVIGIDVFGFNANKTQRPDFSKDRLKGSFLTFSDFGMATLNKQALLASLSLIKANYAGEAEVTFQENGQYNPNMMLKDTNPILAKGDVNFLPLMFQTRDFYKDFTLSHSRLDLFKQLVQTCKERNINLYVFFCPSQAIYWESLYRMGLEKHVEDLKFQLASIYPIWDFSTYNCVTTRSAEKDQPFYFECSHFKPLIGNLILDRLFDYPIPFQFGDVLTPETFAEQMAQAKRDRQSWIADHEELVKELSKKLIHTPQ